MCSLLQIWMQKSIWWWLISHRSVAEPWSLSAMSKAVPHSWALCFCLFPWQTKPSSHGKHNCRSHLEWGVLDPPLYTKPQIAFPAQRQGMRSSIAVIALPAPGDKFLPMAQHFWETHPQVRGDRAEELLADTDLFISCLSEITHCVWCSRKARIILTSCYPFFTTEFGLRVHALVSNRNLKLPLSTYCIRMRCHHDDLLQVCKMGWFSPTAAKPRTQILMKEEIQNTARWPCMYQVGPHSWHPWFKE